MTFRNLERTNLIVILLAALILAAQTLLTADRPLIAPAPTPQVAALGFTASFVLGALLMALNLSLVGRLLMRVMRRRGSQAVRMLCVLILPIKTLLLGLALFGLFHYVSLRPAAFVIGIFVILLVPIALGWLKGFETIEKELDSSD